MLLNDIEFYGFKTNFFYWLMNWCLLASYIRPDAEWLSHRTIGFTASYLYSATPDITLNTWLRQKLDALRYTIMLMHRTNSGKMQSFSHHHKSVAQWKILHFYTVLILVIYSAWNSWMEFKLIPSYPIGIVTCNHLPKLLLPWKHVNGQPVVRWEWDWDVYHLMLTIHITFYCQNNLWTSSPTAYGVTSP